MKRLILALIFLLCARPTFAVIAFDAYTCNVGTGNITIAHTPGAIPRGVFIIIVHNVDSSDQVDGVTYGGDTLTRLEWASTGATTEPGSAYIYFLGTSIPTGAQDGVVTVDGTGTSKWACVITVTAAADTEVEDSSQFTSGAQDDPTMDLTTGASVTTFIVGGWHSGGSDPAVQDAGADYTMIAENDFGSQITGMQRRTNNATGGTVAFNYISAAADDVAMVAAAIKESSSRRQIAPIIFQ